jgi:hypothetical protein
MSSAWDGQIGAVTAGRNRTRGKAGPLNGHQALALKSQASCFNDAFPPLILLRPLAFLPQWLPTVFTRSLGPSNPVHSPHFLLSFYPAPKILVFAPSLLSKSLTEVVTLYPRHRYISEACSCYRSRRCRCAHLRFHGRSSQSIQRRTHYLN